MATRQRRIDALTEASQKLDVVRSLMRTRGSHAVPKKQVQELKDAVGKRGAKVTSRGLVVEEEDDDTRVMKTTKQYKWSNERKK